ncbi:MAG: 2-oxo-4-hydroxy-4-carboxy-5-ureidoimidazoline decarboxylase [Candidatus Acidiferrales bacterium]
MSATANIASLNALAPPLAQAALLACCGSTRWARRMVQRRPFEDAADLLAAAAVIWNELAPEDWLEAFSKHPQIGEKPQQESARERAWSGQEQSAAGAGSERAQAALAEANTDYQQRFGYIFIVSATGKTAEETLANLRQRLQNDADTELRVAADEQRKITELRLMKFLSL